MGTVNSEYSGRQNKNPEVRPKRMEIWYAILPMDKRISVQGGNRPVVIVSNDICNWSSSCVTVAPITTRLKHVNMPTHVIVGKLKEEISNHSVI